LIDLHCHILPAIDDGAHDLEDSIGMARQAAEDAITTVCATPHIRHDHDVRIAELPSRVERLNAALRRAELPLEVVSGGEVAETSVAGLDDRELREVSLAGGGWILLEPAPGPLGDSLVQAVDGLRSRGLHALIAHPERHPSPQLAERLRELVDHGALVQMTAALLAGGPAREPMLALARDGLVHVVASDSHSSRAGRPLRLSEGLEALREAEPLRPHLDWIAREAPAAILRGERPEPPY
jgi:protein-tyrosine phosphatase